VSKYHSEIFTNPLNETEIKILKENYSEEEINDIFKPLTKIKSNSSPYKVGYYDNEDFSKNYLGKIVNAQRKQLLATRQISQDDIGELESSIIHKRSSSTGKVSKKTIFKEQLKAYEVDIKIKQIEPKDQTPVILNDEILVSMHFDSNTGFTFSFDDLRVKHTNIEYDKAFGGFQNVFYDKIVNLARSDNRVDDDMRDWDVIKKLINDPDALKK